MCYLSIVNHPLFSVLSSQEEYQFAQTWLQQMNTAADANDMYIQYCMAFPRHFMQASSIGRVTQIRVSGDYQPGNTQWRIGDTTILAEALGLAAFKDVSCLLYILHVCTHMHMHTFVHIRMHTCTYTHTHTNTHTHTHTHTHTLIISAPSTELSHCL